MQCLDYLQVAMISRPLLGFLLASCLTLLCVLPSVAARKPDAKRGHELFERLTCSYCHPGGGNCLNPKKPLKGPEFRKAFPTDADVARVIRTGIPGTSMDAFRKDKLSDEELLDVIAYIRSLPQPDAAKTPAAAGAKNNKPASKSQTATSTKGKNEKTSSSTKPKTKRAAGKRG
jgi:mono/diheme cytochrome c family protein